MDAIDANNRVQKGSNAAPPSLLFLIIDTSPLAWHALSPQLPLPTALANLLVFINAHLAFSQENRVAVLAAHCGRTHWLYPAPPSSHAAVPPPSSNKYRPFALVESSILERLNALLTATSAKSLTGSAANAPLAGAITLALSYINRARLSLTPTASHAQNAAALEVTLYTRNSPQNAALAARILIVSTSAADLASQYIPLTNAMFAAQHDSVPIDVLNLAGDTALLQQAAYTTNGIFISPEALHSPNSSGTSPSKTGSPSKHTSTSRPITLLPYLLQALLPDTTARQHLYPATSPNVDFRAACFCHTDVVSTGYVCSICLSIFCDRATELLDKMECLTCGTKLVLGGVGGGNVAGDGAGETSKKKEKKKKRRREAEDAGVAA